MTAVADLVTALVAAGMDPAAATGLVVQAGIEMGVGGRSKGAVRTERWRAKQASQNVTGDASVTPVSVTVTEPESVTNRHKASPRDGAPSLLLREAKKDSIKEESKREAPPNQRASRLPDDWQLGQREIDYAISKGIDRERIPLIAEKFKTHWWSTGKNATAVNWFLKWCSWVMNEVQWNGTSTNGHRASNSRTYPAAGPAQTGADATLAGMANLARKRGLFDPAGGPGDREIRRSVDLASGTDADAGPARGGD